MSKTRVNAVKVLVFFGCYLRLPMIHAKQPKKSSVYTCFWQILSVWVVLYTYTYTYMQ